MSISFIAGTSTEATSVTLPSHQAGDLIVMWVYKSSAGTRPVMVAGWFCATMRTAASQAACLVWKIAASASEVSGTWTNAEIIAAATYRDSANYLVIGGINAAAATATTVVATTSVTTPLYTANAADAVVQAGGANDVVLRLGDNAGATFLRVQDSSAGVVTYLINGVAPTVVAAFTFDNGDVVVPFIRITHSASPTQVNLVSMKIGYQA